MWEYEAMLWEAGGDILTPDNTKAAFNSASGVQALTTLSQMERDGSLYLDFNPDAGKSENLFNSNKVGMIITGWPDGLIPKKEPLTSSVSLWSAFA